MKSGEQTNGVTAPALQMAAVEHLLLREFNHRVNNELSSAISLISLAAAQSKSRDAQMTLAAVQHRLQSYASVHHSLQLPDYSTTIELTAYLHGLCAAISRSKLEGRGIDLSLSLCPVWMTSERCWFLGMIIFELITNSARHAFRDRPGTIDLELLAKGSVIECRVTDNGASDPDTVPGRGLQIVEALAASLCGTLDVRFGPDGTTSIVSFPGQFDEPDRI